MEYDSVMGGDKILLKQTVLYKATMDYVLQDKCKWLVPSWHQWS